LILSPLPEQRKRGRREGKGEKCALLGKLPISLFGCFWHWGEEKKRGKKREGGKKAVL